MKIGTRLLLLAVTAGGGAVIVGSYLHQKCTVQPLPLTIMNGTPESGENSIRHRLPVRLSTTDRQHLLDGNCRVVNSTDALPTSIKNAFATIAQDASFALANPGTQFNATDVIVPGLPRRRMDFAGVCENRWFIQYEKGGIGLSKLVMVLKLESNGDVHLLWGSSINGDRQIANLADLQGMIVSGVPSGSF